MICPCWVVIQSRDTDFILSLKFSPSISSKVSIPAILSENQYKTPAGLAAGWGVYTVTIRIYDDESMKGWGWIGVRLFTEFNFSLLDYISQELVEYGGKGDSPLFAKLLRRKLKLLIGLKYDGGLHIL